MASLNEMIDALDELLDASAFRDYCPNGLQVEGAGEVSRVVTGVSASVELFEQALARGAQLVLVHHGLFWNGDDPRVVGPRRARLEMLLGARVSLAAYHLPLDAHPLVGNNAIIAKGLGADPTSAFAEVEGRPIGWIGRFAGEGIARAELAARLAGLTGREPLAFLEGPDPVRSVGVVSGGGGRSVQDAIAAGLDAFVTGEAEEWARTLAREARISYLAGGHHATETFGVRALGELLVERYGVEHSYVEIANPV
jgi:dinuclear metal center YbgI/SA1388 family protein